jgi:hypothetical protein
VSGEGRRGQALSGLARVEGDKGPQNLSLGIIWELSCHRVGR